VLSPVSITSSLFFDPSVDPFDPSFVPFDPSFVPFWDKGVLPPVSITSSLSFDLSFVQKNGSFVRVISVVVIKEISLLLYDYIIFFSDIFPV